MGHAYDQMPIHKHENQKDMINRSMDILERFTGKRPLGWLGPGLTQTHETPELLAAAGVKYIGDWVYDDEPDIIRTANGPLVTLPYTVELNDIAMMIVQHHESDYLLRRAIDAFDRLYAEGEHRAKVMAVGDPSLHQRPAASIKYLEAIYDYAAKFDGVLHWNGEQILEWYLKAKGVGWAKGARSPVCDLPFAPLPTLPTARQINRPVHSRRIRKHVAKERRRPWHVQEFDEQEVEIRSKARS